MVKCLFSMLYSKYVGCIFNYAYNNDGMVP